MSDKIFKIPQLNGIRWTNEQPILEPNINSLPIDNQIDYSSYATPIQQTDTDFPVVVLLSDYPDMVLEFFSCDTGLSISTIPLNATASSLIGQTFLQYIAYVDFSTFPTGWCYGRISYTDDTDTQQSWITCPIDVQAEHPETVLVQYQNSENCADVLFTPGNIILQMRVEGNMVGGYQPKAVRDSFEDQRYNPTLLNGINYDVYTFYIGGAAIPDWIIRKLNVIFANCDQVKIEYEFYVATNGTDFKATRPNNQLNRDGMWEIDLQIVPDFEFGQLTAGAQPQGDLIVIRKVWPPLAAQSPISASFSIPGVFTTNSTIDFVQVINNGGSAFNMLLGTTIGAQDIANIEIDTDLLNVKRVGQAFNVPTTVYVTIPDGVNIKALFVYDQLDSPVLNPSTPTSGGFVQNQVCLYRCPPDHPEYFTRDWDISTGLGQVGSLYEGCQILDELAGKYPQGWDRMTIDPTKARGQDVGNTGNEVTITQAVLPNVGLAQYTTEINHSSGDTPTPTSGVARARLNGGNLDYEMERGTIAPTLGLTAPMGAGGDLDITPDSVIYLYFVKL